MKAQVGERQLFICDRCDKVFSCPSELQPVNLNIRVGKSSTIMVPDNKKVVEVCASCARTIQNSINACFQLAKGRGRPKKTETAETPAETPAAETPAE